MEGYKVVHRMRVKGRVWNSACRNDDMLPARWRLRYEIGKTTVPRKGWGPLAVFPELDAAKEFLKTMRSGLNIEKQDFRILRIQYTKSDENNLYNPITGVYYPGADGDMRGTRFASSVTPIEVMEL